MSSIVCLDHDYPLVPLNRDQSQPPACEPDGCGVDTLARATRGWRVRRQPPSLLVDGPKIVSATPLEPTIKAAIETSTPVPANLRATEITPTIRGVVTSSPEQAVQVPAIASGSKLVPVIRKVTKG